MPHHHLRPAVGLLMCLALSCGQSQAVSQGRDLKENCVCGSDIRNVPVGEEFVDVDAALEVVTGTPITLEDIRINGPGIGSVISVVSIEIAPVPSDHSLLTFTPGGVFRTYPPAMLASEGKCRVQALDPVHGFVLAPGDEAHLAIRERAIGIGSFSYSGFTVVYRVGDSTREQTITVGERGSVVARGPGVPPLTKDQRACSKYAQLLPPL